MIRSGAVSAALTGPLLSRPGAPADRCAVDLPLLQAVARVRKEQNTFAGELARIRALPDTTEQLAARSTLFRDRGIALDTSLRDALDRGLLTAGGVRRVAVVGPGLDFVDKAEGQDFYPPQSLHALALAGSLIRLGLSPRDGLSITAFDISPRVLDHLARARARAAAGEGHVLQLPRLGSAVRAVRGRVGDAVADPAPAVSPLPTAHACPEP